MQGCRQRRSYHDGRNPSLPHLPAAPSVLVSESRSMDERRRSFVPSTRDDDDDDFFIGVVVAEE